MDVVGRHRSRPDDPSLVVVLLDDCRHDATGTDAVAAHDDRPFAPILVDERRIEGSRVERPELEDVSDFDRRLDQEVAAAHGTGVARLRLANVREGRVEVASRLDAAEVPAVTVRTGNELTFPQRLVGNHFDRDVQRPDRAAVCTEGLANLVIRRRPEGRLEDRHQLLFAQAVVSADEREHQPVADDDRHRLRRRRAVDAEELGECLDRRHAWRLHLLGCRERVRKLRGAGDPARCLDVGEVVAVLAAHELVLPRAGRSEKPGGLLPTHDPGLGLDEVDAQPTALEDPLVRLPMAIEARVEPGLVPVERVRVLHDELANPQQSATRARLVALLRREVVPDLRQVPVRVDLSRVERHRLLVRQRQHERPTGSVRQLDHRGDRNPPGALP